MLNIDRQETGRVPVLTLQGRLDSRGAALLEKASEDLDGEGVRVVVDLSDVDYLSSLGIRALMALEKRLKSRSGGLVLTGLNPFVTQVLSLSGLLTQFLCAESPEQALRMIEEPGSEEDLGEVSLAGRAYRVVRWREAESELALWGEPWGVTGSGAAGEHLVPVSMEDLGYSIGFGGFGRTRAQAAECPGLFAAAGWLTGLRMADGHGTADFLVVERPSEAMVHVGSGAGFTGDPLLQIAASDSTELGLEALLGDALDMVDRMGEAAPPLLGVVLTAQGGRPSASGARRTEDSTGTVLIVGAMARSWTPQTEEDPLLQALSTGLQSRDMGNGVVFLGHGIGISGPPGPDGGSSLEDCARGLADLSRVETVFEVQAGMRVRRPQVWVFRPSRVVKGEEKLLRVEVETDDAFPEPWEMITRRLYADAARVVLRPIHGGYSAKTFQVDTYGRDGLRWIPTVLKIARTEVSRREEVAFRRYVEKTILNNSTAIMGAAQHGDWMGLRYNFVGIGGTESRLTWLADRVRDRPAEALVLLFERLFTVVLKPWYGQPRWEETFLFEEHDPRGLFPRILQDAREALSIRPEDETIPCTPLKGSLPNPYRFLAEAFPLRRREGRLWYRSICHGDLNMQNVLVDERDNLYVIDYSETAPRNVVSDFARLEAILKIETTRLESETDLAALMRFERALGSVASLDGVAPLHDEGRDPMVPKVYALITLLRSLADRATLFEKDMTPYWLALLQWTLPVVSYPSAGPLQKRFAAYSAGILVRNILENDRSVNPD